MIRFQRLAPLSLLSFLLAFVVLVGSDKALKAQTSTTTTLHLSPACTTPGCVTTLTATVMAGGTAVHPGLVIFCWGPADCTSGARLGTAQLLTNGTATIKLGLQAGSQTVHAIFHGTKTDQKSASSPQIVTAPQNPADKVALTFSTNVQPYNGLNDGFQASAALLFSGPEPPTGTVSFVDTSRNNALLQTVPLVSPSTTFGVAYPTTSTLNLSRVPATLLTGTKYDAAGDFNNDGFQDILVKDVNSNLAVLLGDGQGGFTPGSFSSKTNAYGPIIVGDFNSDGKLDFAISDPGSSAVYVSLGNGDGTFAPIISTNMSDSPQYLSTGDFNNDGILDIATVGLIASSGQRTIHVILGKGDGSFTQLAANPIDIDEAPRMLVIADFNQDGNLDIATSDQEVYTLKGNGDGTFALPVQFRQDNLPFYLAAGDFDGDGIPDLAYAGNTPYTGDEATDNTGDISFARGNGDGTFTEAQTATYSNPSQFFAFNSPLLTAAYNGYNPPFPAPTTGSPLGIFGVAGIGGIESFAVPRVGSFIIPESSVAGAASSFQTALADFNGDGFPDVVAFNSSATGSGNKAQFQITGSASTTKQLVLDAGVHNIVATYSGDGFHSPATSAPFAVMGREVAFGNGFPESPVLILNGSASIQNGALQLTNGGEFEASSVFSPNRVSQNFITDFDFVSTKSASDGFAFVFQANGPNAIGSSGGGVGYGNPPGGAGPSITNSFALVVDTHDNQGEGSNSVRVEVDGVTSPAGAVDLTPSGIDLHNGHTYHVALEFLGAGNCILNITDKQLAPDGSTIAFAKQFITLTDQAEFNLGYVGFTGSTGASTGAPTILNWTVEDNDRPIDPGYSYPFPNYPNGFAGSTGLSYRGGAAVARSAIQLTNGNQFTSSSVFTTAQVLPSGVPFFGDQTFSTDFDFQIQGGIGDGFAFVLQNQGLNALGTSGGGLGYGPAAPGAAGARIQDSLAIKFDLHDNYGETPNSTGLYFNGASPTVPSIDLTPSGVSLSSGHTFHAQIIYNATTLKLSITDLTSYKVFTKVLYSGSDLPTLIPAQAYAGFTAGTGATPSSIKIFNWDWTYGNEFN